MSEEGLKEVTDAIRNQQLAFMELVQACEEFRLEEEKKNLNFSRLQELKGQIFKDAEVLTVFCREVESAKERHGGTERATS